MKIEMKQEIKTWTIYFAVILLSVFTHELGHCIPAWIHGFKAIPTPAKEYIIGMQPPPELQSTISMGGIMGSVLFSLAIIFFYLLKSFRVNSAILAGAIANPGMYTLRFLLKGRGHDETEFQEAQSALGFNFSGHAVDWIFLLLFLGGAVIWFVRTKPGFNITGRILIGFVLTFIFVVMLQDLNNALFDPIFQPK